MKFRHVRTSKNANWGASALKPLRSCLLNNNAEFVRHYFVQKYRFTKWQIRYLENFEPTVYNICRTPKYLSTFAYFDYDQETGEEHLKYYETDDLKGANSRKIKAIDKFSNYYHPLYKSKEISLLFHTFTRVQQSSTTMRRVLDNIKNRYHSLGYPIRGYLWILEVSENDHIHYHLTIAIDRIQVKKMPEELKFNGLWGQRTQVKFVKRSVRGYLKKYLSKDRSKVLKMRNYGTGRQIDRKYKYLGAGFVVINPTFTEK